MILRETVQQGGNLNMKRSYIYHNKGEWNVKKKKNEKSKFIINNFMLFIYYLLYYTIIWHNITRYLKSESIRKEK